MSLTILKASEVDPSEIAAAVASVLRAGRLAVIPTETVYGLAAQIDDPEAMGLIYAAKSRDKDKPIPLLASCADVLFDLGIELSPAGARLAEAFWPGALTIVTQRGSLMEGVRVPDHALARDIISECGGILRVTSANQSGEPPALNAEMAMAALSSHVDILVDAGPVEVGVPSTVVKCINEGFDILREGAINSDSIANVLQDD